MGQGTGDRELGAGNLGGTGGQELEAANWASSIATLYHPPVRNEELRLLFLLAHSIANGEKRSMILLSVCASHLPHLAGGVLVLAGLENLLPTCLLLESACCLQERIAPCQAEMEASYGRVL